MLYILIILDLKHQKVLISGYKKNLDNGADS